MISDIDNTALLCHTNKPASGANSGGDWFAPDGTRVNGNEVPGFTRDRKPMVVRLLRNSASGAPADGMYYCVIEDDALTEQTVYVGLYKSGRGKFKGAYIYMYITKYGSTLYIGMTMVSPH